MKLLLGHCIGFDDQDQLTDTARGGLLIDQGVIQAMGDGAELVRRYPQAQVVDHGSSYLMPGFVDAHVHYPQLPVIASHGEQLLEWLERYTFPEESKYGDLDYACAQAEQFLDLTLAYGTTSAAVFSTVHATSAEALFQAAGRRNLRLATGKVLMDRNCPESLRDDPVSGYQESERLIRSFHGQGRLEYAITPRFAPTSSAEQLAACAALWDAYPDVLLQTHLSENADEIRWVSELFPASPDYLGVYEQFDLVRPRALFGHAIHLSAREADSLRERGGVLVHCPTSNLFLGSGLFEFQAHARAGQRLALASDVGGGSALSMWSTMLGAYQVSAMLGQALDAQQLLYASTLGGARSLGWDCVGNLAVGYEADILVIDPHATALASQRIEHSTSLEEALFALIVLADDRHVSDVYVAGQRVSD